jgi:hypothetical protein
VHSKEQEIVPVSKRKKADPEFVPKVIEEDWDDEPYPFAFIPQQIKATDNYDPVLEGFPLSILFGGFTTDAQSGKLSPVEVFYEPAPETFRENVQRREMGYFTKPKNGYSIRVIFEKSAGGWQTKKFKGKKLIQTAFGSTFDGAMIQTTMSGPEPDER